VVCSSVAQSEVGGTAAPAAERGRCRAKQSWASLAGGTSLAGKGSPPPRLASGVHGGVVGKTTANQRGDASTASPVGRRGDCAPCRAGPAASYACGGRRGGSRVPQATQAPPHGRGGDGPPASPGCGRPEERRRSTWEAPQAPGGGTCGRRVNRSCGPAGAPRTQDAAGTSTTGWHFAPGRWGRPLQGKVRRRPLGRRLTPRTRRVGPPRTWGRTCRQEAARTGHGRRTPSERTHARPPRGGGAPTRRPPTRSPEVGPCTGA
jgi:hypothetical protein